ATPFCDGFKSGAFRHEPASHPWTGLLTFSSQFRSARPVCVPLTDQCARPRLCCQSRCEVAPRFPTPSLAFSSCVVEAHEPMRVQTFRLDIAVISELARSTESESDTTLGTPIGGCSVRF